MSSTEGLVYEGLSSAGVAKAIETTMKLIREKGLDGATFHIGEDTGEKFKVVVTRMRKAPVDNDMALVAEAELGNDEVGG